MAVPDKDMHALTLAWHEGRHDEALARLLALFDGIVASEALAKKHLFMTMFTWGQLIETYAPAREALARARDVQAARLLDGDDDFRSGRGWPDTRFGLIVQMNRDLGDTCATRDLFVRLEALAPEQAARQAWIALPAMVAAGDFARAARYLPYRLPRDLAGRLAQLNADVSIRPLFPAGRSAPRLITELSNFVQELMLCAATLEGLGCAAEARALCDAALDGMDDEEMRAWTRREFKSPGAIRDEIVARWMAEEEAAVPPASTPDAGEPV
jgi:hypothetical protein